MELVGPALGSTGVPTGVLLGSPSPLGPCHLHHLSAILDGPSTSIDSIVGKMPANVHVRHGLRWVQLPV